MGTFSLNLTIGHLGRDPEVRTAQNGDKIVNLSLATNEKWVDKGSGEKKEKTEWHRVVIFNQSIADFVEKYLKKGALVLVWGQNQTRKWTDNQGIERYSTEVVIGRFRGELVHLADPNGKPSTLPPPVNGPEDYGSTKVLGGNGNGQGGDFGGDGGWEPPPLEEDPT